MDPNRRKYAYSWLELQTFKWLSQSTPSQLRAERPGPLTLDAQDGGDSLATVTQRYLGAARKQIDKTARLIRGGHPAFARIPKDRPVVGIVTTAEQFYLGGTPFSAFASSGEVPVTTLSLRDLKFLVGLSEIEAAKMVIGHAHPEGEGGRFGGAFSEDVMKRQNPILKAAWSHYEFLAKMDGQESPAGPPFLGSHRAVPGPEQTSGPPYVWEA